MNNLIADFLTMEILNNEELYSFLITYYLEELSDPLFLREYEASLNKRLFLAEHFAAWLPWEKHYPEIKIFFAQL